MGGGTGTSELKKPVVTLWYVGGFMFLVTGAKHRATDQHVGKLVDSEHLDNKNRVRMYFW